MAQPERPHSFRNAAPLARAFSHADSRDKRPLFDALDNGFSSLEVDVWLVDGELLVGHDREDLTPNRTLEALYLKPLAERVRRNGGRVYPSSRNSVQLMIDIKTASEPSYRAVHALLEKYKDIVTVFGKDAEPESAVTVVISGERAFALMQSQDIRYAAYDGRLSDLGARHFASLIPIISDEWSRHFTWRGEGEMPAQERRKLREIVNAAHAGGQRIRFWATPETPRQAREAVWKELVAARVDYINTDHLPELNKWLLTNDSRPSAPEIDWFVPSRAKEKFPRNLMRALNIFRR